MKATKEPAAVRELHRIRQQLRDEEQRVGSDRFLAQTNRQGRDFARRHGLKYVVAKSTIATVREKPTKGYKAG